MARKHPLPRAFQFFIMPIHSIAELLLQAPMILLTLVLALLWVFSGLSTASASFAQRA
jgi:hypothetical protein